jgi:hypothetical protein
MSGCYYDYLGKEFMYYISDRLLDKSAYLLVNRMKGFFCTGFIMATASRSIISPSQAPLFQIIDSVILHKLVSMNLR